jgi:bifunctional non-homologous end joining protein LigD
VVVGFTDRAGAPLEVGSLLLGYHQDGILRYAGSVGTGWNAAASRDLRKRLQVLEVETPAVDPGQVSPGRWSRRAAGAERWVQPKMVAEVAFTEWTPDGKVRHASFKGLRTDKSAASVTRELPKEAALQRKGPKRVAAATR